MRRQALIAKQQQIMNLYRERFEKREVLAKMGLEKGVINDSQALFSHNPHGQTFETYLSEIENLTEKQLDERLFALERESEQLNRFYESLTMQAKQYLKFIETSKQICEQFPRGAPHKCVTMKKYNERVIAVDYVDNQVAFYAADSLAQIATKNFDN